MLFNSAFANSAILSWFFFLIVGFLISAVIAQIFDPTTELVIPIRISNKEAKEEIETHPVTAEAKISVQ